MEKLFISVVISQIALFLTLEFGLKKGILKKDMYINISKILCFVIIAISIYILSK